MSPADRLIRFVYNLVWWVPVVLVFLGILSYRAGFVGFLVIAAFRAVTNVYRNNVVPVEAAQRFPLRIP